MSSITKATARPVSTIRNASAWSLAGRIVRPRLRAVFTSLICRMLVVPDVETTVLPLRSSIVVELGGLLGDEAGGGQEVGVGEGDLLLTVGVVRGRTAFEVDGAVGDQRDAGRRGDRVELDLELRQLQVRLHRVDDLQADLHRVADRLLVVVEVGEGHRGVAVADGDRAVSLIFARVPVRSCACADPAATAAVRPSSIATGRRRWR